MITAKVNEAQALGFKQMVFGSRETNISKLTELDETRTAASRKSQIEEAKLADEQNHKLNQSIYLLATFIDIRNK